MQYIDEHVKQHSNFIGDDVRDYTRSTSPLVAGKAIAWTGPIFMKVVIGDNKIVRRHQNEISPSYPKDSEMNISKEIKENSTIIEENPKSNSTNSNC